MSEEIDIKNFLTNFQNNKRNIIGIVVVSFFISIVYALSAQQYFKATAHIIPPNEKSVQALNVIFEGNLIFKTKGTVQTDQVYRKFVLNVQSRKLQRKFFFENKLHEYFSEKDFEKSFEENFHNNLSFTLSARTASRHFREELFLSIGFVHADPALAADWLNRYVDMVNTLTAEELADGINRLLENTKISLKGQITSKINLAEKTVNDKITRLSEALKIAEKLGITENRNVGGNEQNVILSESGGALTQTTPLYLMGSKILRAEINALEQRTSYKPFIPGLRKLQQKYDAFDQLKVNASEIVAGQIDQRASTPTMRFAPKRKLIVLLGTSIGVFIAFIYLLSLSVIRRLND